MMSYLQNFLTMPKVVYLIIAISCWYYPNPDVATSNAVDGVINVPMTPETLKELQRILGLQEIGAAVN